MDLCHVVPLGKLQVLAELRRDAVGGPPTLLDEVVEGTYWMEK